MSTLKSFLAGVVLVGIGTHGALAADRLGNGGDGVVCHGSDGQIVSVELLDIYEARTRSMTLDPAIPSTSRREHIAYVLDRLTRYDLYRGQKYQKRAIQILKDIEALEADPSAASELVRFTSDRLVDIPDTGMATYPEGCQIDQMIVRADELFPGDKRFTIRKSLWTNLNSFNQAASILHEAIYEDFSADGFTSATSRYFNAAIHGAAFQERKDYFALTATLKIRPQATPMDLQTGNPDFAWEQTGTYGKYEGRIGRCIAANRWEGGDYCTTWGDGTISCTRYSFLYFETSTPRTRFGRPRDPRVKRTYLIEPTATGSYSPGHSGSGSEWTDEYDQKFIELLKSGACQISAP